MRATIVIPTYWGRPAGESFNETDAVYDHPTPLDQPGTITRALDSIKVLRNRDFNVVVLASATSADIARAVEDKVKDLISPFRDNFPVTVVSHSFEARMRGLLDDERKQGKSETDSGLLSLTGYSNIRNMCLIVAELARSEVAVLFDDDQIYEDPAYMDKALENIGTTRDGKFVGAIAGYYQRPDGSYLLPPPEEWWMGEWPMVTAMNEAFGIIGEAPRLKPTPFVFGGNMVIHRDVFRKISFDPNVRRGEDIDYLVNCKFFDIDFLLDRELAIKHLPPESHVPAWAHFRENIYRFVYAREKLRRQVPTAGIRSVEVEELDPYPGQCMKDNLEDLIFKTSVLMGLHFMKEGDERAFQECMNNVHLARYDAPPKHDPFAWYLESRVAWERLMEFLSTDDRLSEDLLSGM